MEAKLDSSIGCAASCLWKLPKQVWENQKLRLKTKIVVYNACVLSTLLNGYETWPIYVEQTTRQ